MARPKLETIVNVVMLATCCLLAYGVLTGRAGSVTTASNREPAAPFVRGQPAESLPGIRYGDAQATVVLYIKSTCRYCTASMPTYRSLRSSLAEADVQWVAVSQESIVQSQAYLEAQGLTVDKTIEFVGSTQATPITVLVDREGVVRHFWIGQLNAEREREVRMAVSERSVPGS